MSHSGIAILNPATEQEIERVACASAEDMRLAVARGRAAAAHWRRVPLHERVQRVRDLASLIRQHLEPLAQLLSMEVGKVLSEARDEVGACAMLLEGYANQALHSSWHALPGDAQPGFEHDLLIVTREPLGVVGVILPFNFPLDLFAHKVGPSLAVGNTVVLKPSEDAPLAVMQVARLAREAGIPDDVLQVMTGDRESGRALVECDLDAMTFTGSTAAGIDIASRRAKHLTPTFLELGGNDSAIVFDDADLEQAANAILFSRTLVNGQCCCATKRIIAVGECYDSLIALLSEKVSSLKLGDPQDSATQVGPLINATAAERVAQQIAAVLEHGATIVTGSSQPNGNFLTPLLLADVQADNPIASDMEVFAPVFPVLHAASDDEAVAIANSSRYGLNSSVFSRDTARAVSAARRLEVGSVAINGAGLFRFGAAPFGGYKHTGLGREGYLVSLEEMTQAKTINLRGYWA
jgi:succinate-semialdehyde dehydrogenase / glutarate-semialdehyde dehydrogenase